MQYNVLELSICESRLMNTKLVESWGVDVLTCKLIHDQGPDYQQSRIHKCLLLYMLQRDYKYLRLVLRFPAA